MVGDASHPQHVNISPADCRTSCQVSSVYHFFRAIQTETYGAVKTMEEGEKELEETSKALEYFRDNPDRTTADAKQEKERALRRLQTEIQELTGQLRRLKKRFEQLESAGIKAERQVYCGVRIRIGEKTLLLDKDMEGLTFTLGEDGISF